MTMSALMPVMQEYCDVAIGPLVPDDSAALFRWVNDVKSAGLDVAYRPVDGVAFNAWLGTFATDTSKVLFVIRRRGNPAPCGYIQITNIHPIHRSAEIGIRIGSDEDRGRGIGKSALKLAVDYVWNHLNLNRIQLTVLATNLRAIRAYKAVGFEEEGLFRRAVFINGVWTDVLAMATLRPPSSPSEQWARAAPIKLAIGNPQRAGVGLESA
jgi:RimJ/RimL family protein N-acetyltransferase